MIEYHKIQTVFLRDPATNHKTLLEGQFAEPEFEYLAKNEWVFTEKVDGTNIRIMLSGPEGEQSITFGGKTDAAQIPAFLVERLQQRFHSAEARETLSKIFSEDSACLYGEGYGARIQKGGGNYRKDQDFVLFDVKVGDWWLQRKDIEDVAARLGIDVVPVIGYGTLHNMVDLVRDGFDSQWGPFTAEGIVARPRVELKTRSGKRVITKLKHHDFHPRAKSVVFPHEASGADTLGSGVST